VKVDLCPPAPEIRYTLAGLYSYSSVPDRVALQALALAVSWPQPPWQAEAQTEADRANQEELEARQFLKVAKDDEVSGARMALLTARQNLQKAHQALAETAFALRDVRADARLAMDRLALASVSPAIWSAIGDKLISAWLQELQPASQDDVVDALVFILPPLDRVPDGG
jgi:hypothetical protein